MSLTVLFAAPSPTTARLVLCGLLILLLAGLTTRVPPTPVGTTKDQGDVALFSTVARRVGAGEPYYSAMGSELRRRGYPTASVFNWRTPLALRAVAGAPQVAAVCLVSLAATALLVTFVLLKNAPAAMLLVALILQAGAVTSVRVIPDSVTVAEIWIGLLILLSVVAYAVSRPWTGVALGILALFVRELAAPYCVVCGVMALWRRRWLELAAWAVGASLYAAYFISHVHNVAAQIQPGDIAHQQTWVQFGGLRFVLGTISFIGWFAALRPWGAAVGCVLIIASLWSPQSPLHLRAAAVTYLAFFAIVGQVFNQNWGLVTAPCWALACGFGLDGIRRLALSAVGRSASATV